MMYFQNEYRIIAPSITSKKEKTVFFKERENFLKSFRKNLEIKLAIYLKLLIVSRDLFWLQGGKKNNDKHLYRSWKNQSHHGNHIR
jgi:hypothetical protein